MLPSFKGLQIFSNEFRLIHLLLERILFDSMRKSKDTKLTKSQQTRQQFKYLFNDWVWKLDSSEMQVWIALQYSSGRSTGICFHHSSKLNPQSHNIVPKSFNLPKHLELCFSLSLLECHLKCRYALSWEHLIFSSSQMQRIEWPWIAKEDLNPTYFPKYSHSPVWTYSSDLFD